jgi:excisionase family DNA binding protein
MNLQTISQAAGVLGMTRQGVLDHIVRRNLPATKLGSYYVITAQDLEVFKRTREAKQKGAECQS